MTREERWIGKIEKEHGPILLAVGGLHGNEPAGIQAIQEILLEMSYREDKLGGSIYGMRGNLQALRAKRRYIDADLNRMWLHDPQVEHEVGAAEYEEFLEISEIIQQIKAEQGDRQLILLDLHTTSADSLPFLLCSSNPQNRRLVKPIPVPTIFGVERRIKGTLNDYLNTLGDAAIVFEAGRHDDPYSITYHKVILQLILVGAGMLNQVDMEDFEGKVSALYQHCRSMQYIFEIMFRYGIKPGETFKMEPGFKNFMPIEQGQVLAHNERGEIVSPLPGRIFMPLYQELGDDGFFIIDEIK